MERRVAVIVSSDSGYEGKREDQSGPEICRIAEEHGYRVVSFVILPDDQEKLTAEMERIADERLADLILTTGGTGFSPRDCMPEATLAAVEREVPGIPEAMRAHSLQFTKRAMLSRSAAGIRKQTLIVNLPGSPKAVRECLEYVITELAHGLDVLTGNASNCGAPSVSGKVLAVCISEKRGTPKKNIHEARLIENFGIENDAHAGEWHRQVSLLSYEKIEAFRARGAAVEEGAFGENLIVSGMDFRRLPEGTRFRCVEVVLELTQIGKECHSGCEIFKQMGECIMPKEGVFARVLHGGTIREGDELTVI